MPLLSPIEISLGQATDAGPKPENQDCMGIHIPDHHTMTMKGIVAAIADGVSSADAAREASEVCIRNFITDYYSTPETWDVKQSVQRVLHALNTWLNSQNAKHVGSGYSHLSTLSILILKSNHAHIFHIGDTRIYRIRADQVEQLTRDHCYVVDKKTQYLSRAMGMDNFIDIDYQQIEVKPGDRFFLCTDGVYEFIDLKEHFKQHTEITDFEVHCQQIIDSAKTNNSTDNLTCQLIQVDALVGSDPDTLYQQLSTLRFPPELSAGMIFDGYHIEKELYASARSQLYIARNVQSGQTCVLKTPSVNFEGDAAYIEQFTLEPWLASQIDNPHIINTVPTPHTSERYLYFLMEYVPGETLASWIDKRTAPDIPACANLLEQIVSGVRALHRKQIIHQDLKPDNILLNDNGEAVIIDLGSAFVPGLREVKVPFERHNAMGTRRYSAPELFTDHEPTYAADLFSIGCIFYEMVTGGHHPYGESYSDGAWKKRAIEPMYIPAAQFNPHVSAAIDATIYKAVAFRPEDRYTALSEFIGDISTPNHALSIPKSRKMVQFELAQQKRINITLMISNIVTLLLLVAILMN